MNIPQMIQNIHSKQQAEPLSVHEHQQAHEFIQDQIPEFQPRIEPSSSLKKDPEYIYSLLSTMGNAEFIATESSLTTELFNQIRRRMLRTNLSDRRALGGLLGTAIIGIVGLAVGLNVIGIIIGGIIGAVVGNYAGRSIKENAMRKKKLLHVDLEVIKLAAFCAHIIEAEDESLSLAELRRLMRLLFRESRMLLECTAKLEKYERLKVESISKKLLRCLQNKRYIYSLKQAYWLAKHYILHRDTVSDATAHAIGLLCYEFLRPLGKLFNANRKVLDAVQIKLESKISLLLLSVPLIELRERFPEIAAAGKYYIEADHFLENLYKELNIDDLREMMRDGIVQEILNEEQQLQKNQQPKQSNNLVNSQKLQPQEQQLQQQQQLQQNPLSLSQQQQQYQQLQNQQFTSNQQQQQQYCDLIENNPYSNVIQLNNVNINVLPNTGENTIIFNPNNAANNNNNNNTNNSGNKNHRVARLIDLIQLASQKNEQTQSENNQVQQQQIPPQVVIHQNKYGCQHFEGPLLMDQQNLSPPHYAIASASGIHGSGNCRVITSDISSDEMKGGMHNILSMRGAQVALVDDNDRKTMETPLKKSKGRFEENRREYAQTIETNMGDVAMSSMSSMDMHKIDECEKSIRSLPSSNNNYNYDVTTRTEKQLQQFEQEQLRKQQNSNNNNNNQQNHPVHQQVYKMNESKFIGALDSSSKSFIRFPLTSSGVRSCVSNASFQRNQINKGSFVKIPTSVDICLDDFDASNTNNQSNILKDEGDNHTQRRIKLFSKDDGLLEYVCRNKESRGMTMTTTTYRQNNEFIKLHGKKKEQSNKSTSEALMHEIEGKFAVVSDLIEDCAAAKVGDWDVLTESETLRVSLKRNVNARNNNNATNNFVWQNSDNQLEEEVETVFIEGVLEGCALNDVFRAIYDEKSRREWDGIAKEFSVLETIDEGVHDIVYFYIDQGLGVHRRDFVLNRCVRHDFPDPGDITIVLYSTQHAMCPPRKQFVRAEQAIAAYVLRAIGDEEGEELMTHLRVLTVCDFKGGVQGKIRDFLLTQCQSKWLEQLKSVVFQKQSEKEKPFSGEETLNMEMGNQIPE